MTEREHPRRCFLKLGASAGAGLALGCLSAPHGRLLAAADSDAAERYRMTAYCCQRCDQCELYRFRQCSTCKFRPGGGCTIKRCAVSKGVITCAHCAALPTCDKEFWKQKPEVRKLAEALRAQLQAAKK